VALVQKVEGLRKAQQHDCVDDSKGEHISSNHRVNHGDERTCVNNPQAAIINATLLDSIIIVSKVFRMFIVRVTMILEGCLLLFCCTFQGSARASMCL